MRKGGHLFQVHSYATVLFFLVAVLLESTLAFNGMNVGNKHVLFQENLRMAQGIRNIGFSRNNDFTFHHSGKGQNKIAGMAGRQLFASPNYEVKREKRNDIYHFVWKKALLLKQKIRSSKAFVTKFVALSLMFWSLRPNQAFALIRSKEVAPPKSQATSTVVKGIALGVGATLIVRNIKKRKDDDNKFVEEKRAKLDNTIEGGKKLADSTAQKVTKITDKSPAPVIQEEKKRGKSIEDEKIRKIILEQEQETAKKKAAKAAAEKEAAMIAAMKAEKEARAKAAAVAAEEKAKRIAEEEAKRLAEEEKIRAANKAAAKHAEEVEARRKKAKEEEIARAQKLKDMAERKKKEEMARAKQAEEMAKAKQAELDDLKAREAKITAPTPQPSPKELEPPLAEKYNSIEDLEEKAFAILVDLKMVCETPDPEDPNYDHSVDNDLAVENKFLE